MFKRLVAISALLTVASASSHAGIIFTFTQVGRNVVMNSSGVIDTNQLVLQPDVSQWNFHGVEENGGTDVMGGTGKQGPVDISFGFHAGTDFSPWASADGPWAQSTFFPDRIRGTKGFATYIRIPAGGFGPVLPGLGVERQDIVGGLWSPDQSWTFNNSSFASRGMFAGTYTVTDAVTGEFITFQMIAPIAPVPEPSTLFLMGLGLAGLGLTRRRTK